MRSIDTRLQALERALEPARGLVATLETVSRASLELEAWRAEQAARIGSNFDASQVAEAVERRLLTFVGS